MDFFFDGLVELVDVLLLVFKYYEEFVFVFDDFFHFDDVGVVHFAQRLDFSQVDAFVPGLELLIHAFDGHDFACFLTYFITLF
jgi:hypothetical protein